jgi:hypothetical protein
MFEYLNLINRPFKFKNTEEKMKIKLNDYMIAKMKVHDYIYVLYNMLSKCFLKNKYILPIK